MLPLKTLTLVVLCGLPPQWLHRTWTEVSRDLVASVLCFSGHFTGMPPRLPFSLAIAYVVWVSTPGSFSWLTLPRHSEFMRSLVFPPTEQPEDCKVCWDEKRLAQIPCGHRFCKSYLQLIGERYQTSCLVCRTPLFSRYDRMMFMVSKGAVAIAAVNLAIYPLRLVRELQASKYALAIVSLGSMSPMVFYLVFVIFQCRQKGEDWWRDSADPEKLSQPTQGRLKAAAFALGTGLFIFSQTLWITRNGIYA
jgi:hypothetical protein